MCTQSLLIRKQSLYLIFNLQKNAETLKLVFLFPIVIEASESPLKLQKLGVSISYFVFMRVDQYHSAELQVFLSDLSQ